MAFLTTATVCTLGGRCHPATVSDLLCLQSLAPLRCCGPLFATVNLVQTCAVDRWGTPVSDFIERERIHLKSRWTVILVLITCCAVTVLVAQQGDTIDRQRSLIQLLWGDSKELNTLKIKEYAGRHAPPKPAPDAVAPTPPSESKPPASKPRARKPKPPQQSERQAIEKPGPRLLRYI
jgi:hypothetical protein